MSGVAIIRNLLVANANLTAVVSANNIIAGTLPLNITVPAISIEDISGVPRRNMGMVSNTYLFTDRVRIDVKAGTYPQKKSVLELVRLALPNRRGAVGNYTVDSVLPDSKGPDRDDPEIGLYFQYRDYIVKYYLTAPS